MRTYLRYTTHSSKRAEYGIKEDDRIHQLSAPPWQGGSRTNLSYDVSDVILLAPVQPSKVICVGLNYTEHVGASQTANSVPDEPMLFLKPPSSIIGTGQEIIHPAQSKRVDFEAELGVVIQKKARNVSAADALDHVLGFTCVNDVTARDLQKREKQWGRSKGFDTFCPVGPWIVSGIDSSSLQVEGVLNDIVKQSGNTSNMIFSLPFLISFISSVMTLEPGDLISTGTPAGIEPMRPGDEIEVRIEKIGTLKNTVVTD